MPPLPLHALLLAQGATLGERSGRSLVEHHGDPLAEYQGAREGAGLYDLSYRDVLRVSGEDRRSFLQGMVTQDLRPLRVGEAAYTAVLTAKGSMVADARVLVLEDALLVDLEPGLGPTLQDFLGRFLISEDAELSLEPQGTWLGLAGPRAEAALQAALGAVTSVTGAQRVADCPVQVVAWNRLGLPGFELYLSQSAQPPVYRALAAVPGVTPLGFEAMEWLRVEAGVPRYGAELTDTTIPLEAHLGHALSYTKGCYIGQEVIARATYRGHMNRHLCGLRLGASPAPSGAQLYAGLKRVGWLCSVIRSPAMGEHVALGYVHRDHQAPGTPLRVEGREAEATVATLPFRPPP